MECFETSFDGKCLLKSQNLKEFFNNFNDGKNYLPIESLNKFMNELQANFHIGLQPNEVQLFQDELVNKCNQINKNHVELFDLSRILSTEENFLLHFRAEIPLSSVDFMEIWYHYDDDRNGYLELAEIDKFFNDLMEKTACSTTKDRLNEFKLCTMELFDKNGDGKIELGELAKILPIEQNFLGVYDTKKLNRQQFMEIFSHYDKDGSGNIEGAELMALLRDISALQGIDPTSKELEEFMTRIMDCCDINHDGKISHDEIGLVFSIKY